MGGRAARRLCGPGVHPGLGPPALGLTREVAQEHGGGAPASASSAEPTAVTWAPYCVRISVTTSRTSGASSTTSTPAPSRRGPSLSRTRGLVMSYPRTSRNRIYRRRPREVWSKLLTATRRAPEGKEQPNASDGQSCSTTWSSELWTSSPPSYSMKPSFRNLFMKKLTLDRVVPTLSASVSWLTFGTTGSGRPSLPKLASNRRILARRFSLELKS